MHIIKSLPLSLYVLRQSRFLRPERSGDPPASAWPALGLQHAVPLGWLRVHAGDIEVKFSRSGRKHFPTEPSPAQPPSSCFTLLLMLPKQMATNLTLRKVSLLINSFTDSSPKWVSAGSIKEIVDICVYWSLWEESTVNCSGCWHDVNLPVGGQLTLPRFQGLLFSPRQKSLLLNNSRRVSSLLHVLDPSPSHLTLKDFEALR